MIQDQLINGISPSKILIVDDNPQNLQVLSSVLDKDNVELLVSNNGKQAIEIAKLTLPDIILLDIMMPEMDGYETCSKLKSIEETQDIPVIFLTARIEPKDIVRGFNTGAVDYITKPFNASELIARVNTHVDLKKTRTRLIELNATKDKFFSIIAHDLKSPINSIISISELLNEGPENFTEEEKVSFLKLINVASKAQLNLLENLLSWARIQTGKMQLNKEKFDLKSLADENQNLLIAQATKKSISLDFMIPEKAYVFADKNMITTVLRNLISNAIKYTFEGGKIQIISSEKNNQIEIQVIDEGTGMKKETVDNLFKVDKANKSLKGTANEKGTGLGLILCYELVTQNNGTISVESKYEKGTTFKVTIPKP